MRSIAFTLFLESGGEQTYKIPAKYVVCDRCEGEGLHAPPSFNGFSADDFAEDPGFTEDYFDGVFDVACEQCHGDRVMLVPDEPQCTPEQLAAWGQFIDQQHGQSDQHQYWQRVHDAAA